MQERDAPYPAALVRVILLTCSEGSGGTDSQVSLALSLETTSLGAVFWVVTDPMPSFAEG